MAICVTLALGTSANAEEKLKIGWARRDITPSGPCLLADQQFPRLSTGVVDIRTKGLTYQTEKLLGFMKKGIINGEFSPFSGEIHARDGRVIQEKTLSKDGDKDTLENMTPAKIITMDWLYENIEGDLEI